MVSTLSEYGLELGGHISFLLLHNKFPQTCHNACLLSHRVYRSGVQAGLNCVVCSHSHKARIKMLARLCSLMEPEFLFKVHVVVGRIQFLVVVEPRPSLRS